MNFYIINGVLEVYKMFFHIFGKKIGIQVFEVKNLYFPQKLIYIYIYIYIRKTGFD
jgi:hypothetical protein